MEKNWLHSICTDLLEIFYEDAGPVDGPPVLLIHGWPDAPCSWEKVKAHLHAHDWRTIIPYLRGSQPTRFLSQTTPRSGAGVALAQDAIDLADALKIERFAVVGHDWGARVAYTLAALFPERVTAVAGLALAYQPRGIFRIPDFQQSRRFWYQWFLCTDGGAEAVRKDPVGFARIQWDTWSPQGWFDEAEFAAAATTFTSPDWTAIALNAYRSRWIAEEPSDPKYSELQRRLHEIENLSRPTLMIQGALDFCDDPKESESMDHFFTNGYERIVLEGAGHFPHRETPEQVAEAVLGLLQNKRL